MCLMSLARMIPALGLGLVLVVTALATAPDDVDAEFRGKIVAPEVSRLDRELAVEKLAEVGTIAAVESLLWGVAAVDEEIQNGFGQKRKLDQEYAPLNSDKLHKEQEQRKDELDVEIAALDAKLADHHAVIAEIERFLLKLDDERLGALNGKFGIRSPNWRARGVAGKVAAALAVVPVRIAAPLLRDKDDRVRLLVADGFARRKDEASVDETIEELGKALGKEKSWKVQAAIVNAFGEIASIRATRHLIELMGSADGRLLEDVGRVLHAITKQNFAVNDFDGWKAWYGENRREIEGEEGGKAIRGRGTSSNPNDAIYGIKSYSKRIVYIIDVSGSMETPLGEGTVTGPDADMMSGPKIELAKRSLTRTIRTLPEDAFFNIIAFDNLVKVWQPKMLKATQANKNEAYKHIRELKPAGSTYLYGALKAAFGMAGMGATDREYAADVDTIVLLTDGAPTDNNPVKSTRMDEKVIIDAVRQWNELAKVTLHVIAIDEARSIKLLRILAQENNGTYVAIPPQK